MNIITGGLGFIGNELVRQIISDHEAIIVDNRTRVAPKINDISTVPIKEIDICDHETLKQFLMTVRPSTVFHLAAIHYIPECNLHPERTTRVNVEGTLSVLRAAQAAGAEHFLLASSGAVYADSQAFLSEENPINPLDVYGWTKHFCEQLVTWFGEKHDMKVTICRLFNNYGPRETNAHILPEIIKQLREGNTLSLGNIKPRRDYIHTRDCAKALRLLAQRKSKEPLIVNVASGHHASVEELIDIMGAELGRQLRVKIDPARFREADKLVQIADISRLRKSIGWVPEIDFKQGLRELLQFEGLL